MATFKPEEIKALEVGGNGVALATYLAKWNPRDAPKPIDRNIGKVRDWIDLVFVKKRFYNPEATFTAPPPSVSRTQSVSSARSTASRENDFVFKASGGGYSNGNYSQQPATEPRGSMSDAGILMDLDSSPSAPAGTGASNFPAQGPAATGGAAGMPSAAAAPQQAQPSGWAAFEESQADAGPAAAAPTVPLTPAIQAAAAPQQQGQAEAFSGWQAFDASPPQASSAPAPAAPAPQANVMKELPSDLFSELAAPMPPQPLAAQPSGYMQQPGYGQVGQVYGHQAGGQAPGYMGPSPGNFPYQYAQPVPPGYQPYMLAAPAGPAPQQQSFPASGAEASAQLPASDVFSSLVPGLKSSLPAIPSTPASSTLPQAPHSNGGMPQSQIHAQYGHSGQQGQPFRGFDAPAGLQNGEDRGLTTVQQPYMGGFAGPQGSSSLQPRKGGNPFA